MPFAVEPSIFTSLAFCGGLLWDFFLQKTYFFSPALQQKTFHPQFSNCFPFASNAKVYICELLFFTLLTSASLFFHCFLFIKTLHLSAQRILITITTRRRWFNAIFLFAPPALSHQVRPAKTASKHAI